MKILISAAEASSDLHGAQLLRALREQLGRANPPETVEAFGVGGPRLQAEGLRAVVDARELLAMGFAEVVGRLPGIYRALKRIVRLAEEERPELVVVLDYPEFHFRLARRIQRLGIPIVYFIPPKVWVWRQGRVRVLRERFTQVLSILPFEVEFYKRHGMDVKYVGNPLVDELPLGLTREEARSRLGLGEAEPTLVVMPGSRPAELHHHLELMLEAAAETARRLRARGRLGPAKALEVLMPFAPTADLAAHRARVAGWMGRDPARGSLLGPRLSQGDAAVCLAAADVGLIKSGTSTLEAALMGCPHAILYRSNPLSHLIFEQLVRRRFAGPVGLVNLIYGWKDGEPWLVREFLRHRLTAGEIADELIALWLDPARRSAVLAGLTQVREQVAGEGLGGQNGKPLSPSRVAAAELIRIARAPRTGGRPS